MVGRSAGFWRWCLPHAQAALPERFAGVTWQEVQRGRQRGAPELHPRQRRRGHLRPAHRPALRARAGAASRATWRSPTCPRRGTSACAPISASTCPTTSTACCRTCTGPRAPFGYFPTYALGNVIAGQVWARVTAELPDLDERFAAGEFAPLREWLAEHVHRFGRRYLPTELLERVVGRGPRPRALPGLPRGQDRGISAADVLTQAGLLALMAARLRGSAGDDAPLLADDGRGRRGVGRLVHVHQGRPRRLQRGRDRLHAHRAGRRRPAGAGPALGRARPAARALAVGGGDRLRAGRHPVPAHHLRREPHRLPAGRHPRLGRPDLHRAARAGLRPRRALARAGRRSASSWACSGWSCSSGWTCRAAATRSSAA